MEKIKLRSLKTSAFLELMYHDWLAEFVRNGQIIFERREVMSVVMFAMIGAAINPHWAYWVAFGLYCLIWLDKYLDVDVKKGE